MSEPHYPVIAELKEKIIKEVIYECLDEGAILARHQEKLIELLNEYWPE